MARPCTRHHCALSWRGLCLAMQAGDRRWRGIGIGLGLYAAMLLVARVWPSVPAWSHAPGVRWLPWVLLGSSALLGAAFAQSRITFGSLLTAVVLYITQAAFLAGHGVAPDPRVILPGGIILSIGYVLLYRLRERGLFTSYGAFRFGVVAGVSVVLLILPHVSSWPGPALADPVTGVLRLPPAVLLAACVCLPVLLWHQANESAALGPLMALALLSALTALNFRSDFWPEASRHSVLLLFAAGAGAALLAAVLDSAWRHANLDELTQLPGRRALKHHAAGLGAAYTAAVVDVDHFKRINDTYGHDVGDQVLRFVASRLRAHAPGRVFRFGGEEFVIVCGGGDYNADVAAIELARQAISAEPFRLRGFGRPRRRPDQPRSEARAGAKTIRVAASAGTARGADGDAELVDVIRRADKALYRAKEAGRDRLWRAGAKAAGVGG